MKRSSGSWGSEPCCREGEKKTGDGKMPGKMKLTTMEKAWILYDVGNSAFILLVSTLFPIYFNAVAQQDGLSSVDYLA